MGIIPQDFVWLLVTLKFSIFLLHEDYEYDAVKYHSEGPWRCKELWKCRLPAADGSVDEVPERDNVFRYLRPLRPVKHEAEKPGEVKNVGLSGEYHKEVILCESLYLGLIQEKFFRLFFEGTQ